MANTFKFGNGNWATKEGSVLAYNDENNNFKPLPFDFTRASTATYVDSDGLIKTAKQGEARIDYTDNTDGHLLLEPSRTNLLTYSEDFTQWANTGSETTDTAAAAISPDGSLNATKLQEANSNFGYHRLSKTITASSATDYALSIFAKKGTQKYVQLLLLSTSNSYTASKVFDLENGTLGETIINGTATLTDANIEDFGNGWYRCTIIAQLSTAPNTFRVNLANAATGNTKSLGMVQYTGDGNGNIYIWGAQFEAGSYLTSYIPTEGSAVTRIADDAENSSTEILSLSNSASFYWNVKGQTEGNSGNNTTYVIRFHTNPSQYSRSHFALNSFAAGWRIRLDDGSQGNFQGLGISKFDDVKVVVIINTSTYSIYANGAAVSTNQSYGGTAPTIQSIAKVVTDMGTDTKGVIKVVDLKAYNTELTATEAIALTQM